MADSFKRSLNFQRERTKNWLRLVLTLKRICVFILDSAWLWSHFKPENRLGLKVYFRLCYQDLQISTDLFLATYLGNGFGGRRLFLSNL